MSGQMIHLGVDVAVVDVGVDVDVDTDDWAAYIRQHHTVDAGFSVKAYCHQVMSGRV